jgi:hypothetical protein
VRAESPNDPKLSDGGGLARPLHGGGKAAAEAAGVTARSSSLQRMVRRAVGYELIARRSEVGLPPRLMIQVEIQGWWGQIPISKEEAEIIAEMCMNYAKGNAPERIIHGCRVN